MQYGRASYVFISYTRRQFYTQIRNDQSLTIEDIETHGDAIQRDKRLLIDFAIEAANTAGVSAFWIDFECIRPEEDEDEEDSIDEVYRICDIVRGAYSTAILLAPPLNDALQHDEGPATESEKTRWLQDWGRRLWTVPEALLSPSDHPIMIFAVGSDQPEIIRKANFADRAYNDDDADAMQQLIRDYLRLIDLSPLQMIGLALECLHRRNTTKRMAGDVSYALQGLLFQRPKVDKFESDFQAFARLSLANDSGGLLERLICLHPTTRDAPWHDMSDVWDAKLWNFVLSCEIADVIDERCVSLGAYAATINWFCLEPVDYNRSGGKTRFNWQALHASAVVNLVLGFVAFISFPLVFIWDIFEGFDESLSWTYGMVFICLITAWAPNLIFCFAAPALISKRQKSQIYDSQARLFGLEGKPDLGQVERFMFGANHNRMKWANSSEVGLDETSASSLRLFTLVDSFTLTATTFTAAEPPAVAIVCGWERDMARALLCSYDGTSSTFVKETTIRMATDVLKRMQWVDRLRFAVVK